ncbi:hypothetical protein M948_18345 [Virgibacillus sp. CM-4]|uniref:hypothetical protein n=1 Tax=Virgibacillus sp. CM-4 TaxID=1354277 RepID=UPI0003882A7D|nr:hypothetical protein [Virgibacillus sp. CM-4]EQB35059.1 hypothetical protein M948_18345 [Virgibacillus sp. CM-4]
MKEVMKSKKLWAVVLAIVLLSVAFKVGESGAKVTLDEEKVAHDELTSKINKLEGKLEETESKLQDEEKRLSERQSEVDETLALVDDRDTIKSEIDNLDTELSDKKAELDDMNSNIESKEEELETLEGDIVKATDKPIELSAGQWVVGTDIPAARYKASGSSNFFVYSSSGAVMVNTILGDSSVGDGDYVFFAEEGDIIESSAAATLTPVE